MTPLYSVQASEAMHQTVRGEAIKRILLRCLPRSHALARRGQPAP